MDILKAPYPIGNNPIPHTYSEWSFVIPFYGRLKLNLVGEPFGLLNGLFEAKLKLSPFHFSICFLSPGFSFFQILSHPLHKPFHTFKETGVGVVLK